MAVKSMLVFEVDQKSTLLLLRQNHIRSLKGAQCPLKRPSENLDKYTTHTNVKENEP